MEISISGEGLLCAALMPLPKQLRRVMKLTTLLVTVACIHVSAHSFSQTVTISGKNVPLTVIFASIEKQTGLSFFFNYTLIKDAKPVTLNVQDAPFEEVLNSVLKEQGLEYYKEGKTVFIVQNTKRDSPSSEKLAQEVVDVKGKVTDQHGVALAGASVYLKKGNRGTLTNEKGFFELKYVPVNATLEISYSGYQKQEIAVNGSSAINVELNVSTNQLDQMEVIAYGQTNQRLSVGDVTTIKAEDIEKQPVPNPLLALEGRVPGMIITQSSGMSDGGVKVQIRGQNTIPGPNIGTDPFYVIDGVPYPSQLLPGLNTNLGSSGSNNGNIVGSPLSFINPSDIESISVLKDADATSIYGSRAANGAILITTKKGKIGRTTVNLNMQAGFGQMTERLHLMNTEQYLQMRHEAISNDGLTTAAKDYDINGTWDSTRYTDWQKTLLGGVAQYDNINASVSGGNGNFQYLIGGTFHRETTVFTNSFSDTKGAGHFNISNLSDNRKFRIQLTGSYVVDDNQLPQADLTSVAVTLAPDAPPLYTGGVLNWAYLSTGAPTWSNPLAVFNSKYMNKVTNLVSNALISYQVLPSLTVSSSFGYANMQSNETAVVAQSTYSPTYSYLNLRSARFGYNNINSWIVEPQITYKNRIGKGLLEGLIGATINQNNTNGLQLSGSGQSSDQSLYNISAATSISITTVTNAVYKYNAAFGRMNYNWNDQYIVNLSVRRDGSSRFGPQNQFHDFGSVGVGWIFSNTQFMQRHFSVISFGKLRGSYGSTGSDQIGDYQFLNLYSVRSYAVPYQGVSSIVSNGLSNPYLAWQETKKLELGTDIGLVKDRIIFNISYYQDRCSNQLVNYTLPLITGFGSITKNIAATVQNTGWEFFVTTTNFKTKNFGWTTSLNASTENNKLIAFPNLANSSYATYYIIGQPINYIQTYHYEGVNSTTGVYQFSDGKGGVTSQPESNVLVTKKTIVKTVPPYFGGLNSSFRYKEITLDFLFQFVKQKGLNYYYGSFPNGYFNVNEPTWLNNSWQKPGDISSHQRFSTGYNYVGMYTDVNQSDAAYTDASFIRLKNVSISWQIPQPWRNRAHLQSLKVYLQGQNLLIFTHYKGLDPETLNSKGLPPLRVVTGGIQVSF